MTRGPRIVNYKGRIRTMRARVCRFSKGNELGREADSFEPCSTQEEFHLTRVTELLLGKAAAFECRVNICNFRHCWISSTSSNYRNSRLKIEIKRVFSIFGHKIIAICICPPLPKSIQDIQRITELQSFVYISVFFFLETTCNMFLKLDVHHRV